MIYGCRVSCCRSIELKLDGGAALRITRAAHRLDIQRLGVVPMIVVTRLGTAVNTSQSLCWRQFASADSPRYCSLSGRANLGRELRAGIAAAATKARRNRDQSVTRQTAMNPADIPVAAQLGAAGATQVAVSAPFISDRLSTIAARRFHCEACREGFTYSERSTRSLPFVIFSICSARASGIWSRSQLEMDPCWMPSAEASFCCVPK